MKSLLTMVLTTVLSGLALGMDLIPSGSAVLHASGSSSEAPWELRIEQGDSDAAEEAEATSDELEELDGIDDYPTMTHFDPRVVEDGDIPEGRQLEAVAAEFALPRECDASGESDLSCPWGTLEVTPVVIDRDGELLAAEAHIDGSTVEVRTDEVDASDCPLTITAYLASSDDAELVPGAVEAFAWMLSAGD